jgi:hypothetical protein
LFLSPPPPLAASLPGGEPVRRRAGPFTIDGS